jgi:hypothetical protein
MMHDDGLCSVEFGWFGFGFGWFMKSVKLLTPLHFYAFKVWCLDTGADVSLCLVARR